MSSKPLPACEEFAMRVYMKLHPDGTPLSGGQQIKVLEEAFGELSRTLDELIEVGEEAHTYLCGALSDGDRSGAEDNLIRGLHGRLERGRRLLHGRFGRR
jgi:hypothetical protein